MTWHRGIIFLLSLMFACTPSILFASSCTETLMSCECAYADGTETSASAEEINTGTLCAEHCNNAGAASYIFYCGDAVHPADSGSISDYLDALAASVGVETITAENPAIPALNVEIPGLDLKGSVETDDQGNIYVNMIGLYVSAVFSYGIILAALFAVLMLALAGFQYMTAGGDKGAVAKAKSRMQNTIFGIIILMATYSIAFLIDPRTTYFNALTLQNVKEIVLKESTMGNEGSGFSGSVGTWENLVEPYRSIVSQAKEAVTCTIPDGIASPTGYLPNQGTHHWYDRGMNGNYKTIHAMDWAAGWNWDVYAPFAGTVTYERQTTTDNYCGNRIYVRSADGNTTITICHVKDFTDAAGNFSAVRKVEQGDVIGHVGGICCSGEKSAYSVTQCNAPGTKCTDPEKSEQCSCQAITEAGNTTGPHVHITFSNMPSGMLLSCLE